MGNCCSRTSPNEETLHKILKNLKLRNLDYEEAKAKLDLALYPQLTDDMKNKLSGKNLAAFEDSLKQISGDNFMKIAKHYYFDDTDSNPYAEEQKIYLQKIYSASNNSKHLILFNLFSLLKSDDKIDSFLYVIQNVESKEISYAQFKQFVFDYVKNNLVLPSLALMGISKDKITIDEIEEEVNNLFTNENIFNFINKILDDFEKMKFLNEEDQYTMDRYIIRMEDIYKIFSKHESDFFNLFSLRALFLSMTN